MGRRQLVGVRTHPGSRTRRLGTAGLAAFLVLAAGPASPASAGGGWVVVPSPNPATSGGTNEFFDVACVSTAWCQAVGAYNNAPTSLHTLAEHWNGARWKVARAPSLGNGSTLRSVACPSRSFCVAVGENDASATIVERWDGSKWSRMATPSTAFGGEDALYGVSCASPTSCMAVGTYYPGRGGRRGLAERWNGTSWDVVPTPSDEGGSITFTDVSCPVARSTLHCTAVGFAETASTRRTVIEYWSGTRWSLQAHPNPQAQYAQLNGVSCPTATTCEAVGDQLGLGSSPTRALVLRWNGGSWLTMTSPNPGLTVTNLVDVSCAEPNRCVAVGQRFTSAVGPGQTLAESWNGATWVTMTTPNRHPATTWNGFYGVECTAATACVGVGASNPFAGSLVESLS